MLKYEEYQGLSAHLSYLRNSCKILYFYTHLLSTFSLCQVQELNKMNVNGNQ